jgi:hypothetical protein
MWAVAASPDLVGWPDGDARVIEQSWDEPERFAAIFERKAAAGWPGQRRRPERGGLARPATAAGTRRAGPASHGGRNIARVVTIQGILRRSDSVTA